MKAVLKIECINDNWGLPPEALFWLRVFNEGKGLPKTYWVAEIIGRSEKYGYERRFLPCKKDYTHANSKGTRGVYAYYILEDGHYYEVKAPVAWRRVIRYFCTARDGEVIQVSEEEVQAWLKNRSASTSTTPPANE